MFESRFVLKGCFNMTTHIFYTKHQFSHGEMTMQVYFVHPEVGHESYVTTTKPTNVNRMKDE